MIPGAGFACGPDAMLALDSDPYCPPTIGTMGGWFVDRTGRKFGVSCAHCLTFSDQGVIVHQPCAMGHILNTCTKDELPSEGFLRTSIWNGKTDCRDSR